MKNTLARFDFYHARQFLGSLNGVAWNEKTDDKAGFSSKCYKPIEMCYKPHGAIQFLLLASSLFY